MNEFNFYLDKVIVQKNEQLSKKMNNKNIKIRTFVHKIRTEGKE
jgi:hypothetical protein